MTNPADGLHYEAKNTLIAAAPELLAACKAGLAAIHAIKHTLEYVHAEDGKIVTDAWTILEQAIEKAEHKS